MGHLTTKYYLRQRKGYSLKKTIHHGYQYVHLAVMETINAINFEDLFDFSPEPVDRLSHEERDLQPSPSLASPPPPPTQPPPNSYSSSSSVNIQQQHHHQQQHHRRHHHHHPHKSTSTSSSSSTTTTTSTTTT